MLKHYRTLEEVLRSPWASTDGSAAAAVRTTDRVLRSTRLDDAVYSDLRQGDETLEEIEQAASKKLRTFPALSRDVFQSFYSIAPRRNEEDQLSPAARMFNAHILTHVTGQDDYATLKEVCEGREFLAYEAASEFIGRTAGELDTLLADMGGEQGTLNTLEKLINNRDKAAGELAGLLEQQRRALRPNPLLERTVLSAANLAQSKQQQVEAVTKMVETALVRRSEQVDAVVSNAVTAAREKAEETQAVLSAWSDEPGEMGRTPVNQDLLARVRRSIRLRSITRYLGRFREIFAQGKRSEYAYGRGENYSLELGNDLSRTITSELALLAAPEMIPLFLRKYQDRRLKQYRRRERVRKGMGDIICCLDESSSTKGDAEAWGKAVAMTLLEIAADGGRKFALIHFSGPGSFHTDLFLPGGYTAADKLRAAEAFLGGGTDFETPLLEALRLMERQGFENADIVFITDGECVLSELFRDQLTPLQMAWHFDITGILLDADRSAAEFSLSQFCQKIYRTSELAGEEIVQALVSDRV